MSHSPLPVYSYSVPSELRLNLLMIVAGKGNEDKRGIPVTHDVYSKSWLYVNGQPVVCNRHMEVKMTCHSNPGSLGC